MFEIHLLIGLVIVAACLLIAAIRMGIKDAQEHKAFNLLMAYKLADSKRANLYNQSVLNRSHN